MEFKSQTIPQLEATIEEATRVLNEKKDVRRAELLAELDGLGKPVKVKAAKAKLTAKYRGPNGETYSGRGALAGWLKKLKDAGQDIEQFRV